MSGSFFENPASTGCCLATRSQTPDYTCQRRRRRQFILLSTTRRRSQELTFDSLKFSGKLESLMSFLLLFPPFHYPFLLLLPLNLMQRRRLLDGTWQW
uniref:Uncharacterized protein n=1 Tax=Manihot esculenta TaxID=3983 RepID=A0A251JZ44_MANES